MIELRKGHEAARHILGAVAATEVHAHQRADFLVSLVAERGVAKTLHLVENRADVAVQLLHHVKNALKWIDFLRFYAYICHVIEDFACFELQH